MTRQEFSQLLAGIRKMEKCSTVEISKRSCMGITQVRRIDAALNNYHLANAIKYLVSLNWGLRLTSLHESIFITDYKYVPEFLSRIRIARNISQSQLAKTTNLAASAIRSAEHQQTTLCIDSFLAIASVLKIDIRMEQLS